MNSGKKFGIEKCDFGMQNCQKILESKEAQECHVVSAENYWYLGLDKAVKEEVFERLRVDGQNWVGNVLELGGTSIYGIRRYTRGAWLLGHLDHLRTHVVSAILVHARAKPLNGSYFENIFVHYMPRSRAWFK